MATIAERMATSTRTRRSSIAVGFFVAFSVKLGLFPFHFWLPTVYTGARPAVAAILSGGLANIGAYGLLRFGAELLPRELELAAGALIVIGAASILYGGVLAVSRRTAQRDAGLLGDRPGRLRPRRDRRRRAGRVRGGDPVHDRQRAQQDAAVPDDADARRAGRRRRSRSARSAWRACRPRPASSASSSCSARPSDSPALLVAVASSAARCRSSTSFQIYQYDFWRARADRAAASAWPQQASCCGRWRSLVLAAGPVAGAAARAQPTTPPQVAPGRPPMTATLLRAGRARRDLPAGADQPRRRATSSSAACSGWPSRSRLRPRDAPRRASGRRGWPGAVAADDRRRPAARSSSAHGASCASACGAQASPGFVEIPRGEPLAARRRALGRAHGRGARRGTRSTSTSERDVLIVHLVDASDPDAVRARHRRALRALAAQRGAADRCPTSCSPSPSPGRRCCSWRRHAAAALAGHAAARAGPRRARSSIVIVLLTTLSYVRDVSYYIDAALALALLSFTATLVAARYVIRGGPF